MQNANKLLEANSALSSAATSNESLVEPLRQGDVITKEELLSDEHSSSAPSAVSSLAPTQKRRRVTRACDECRRKKIKCDGKSPCTHCTVYSYDCTFDQPSHRRRNPGPQYIEALEQRLQKAEAIIHRIAPKLDLNDPNIETSIQSFTPSPGSHRGSASSFGGQTQGGASKDEVLDDQDPSDQGLQAMVTATGQLDLHESGGSDYYGYSSGLNFLRQIRGQFNNYENLEAGGKVRPASTAESRSMSQDFVSPKSQNRVTDSPYEPNPNVGTSVLPTKDIAEQLCADALNDGCSIMNLVHKPSFYELLDRTYTLLPEAFEAKDRRFLPLLYITLAIGSLFSKGEQELQAATQKGYQYFWAARQLVDTTECHDLISLLAVVFMIVFLQCTARLSTCYSYIGIALRSALRMGMHRSFRDSFNPIEAELRKRTFWVIWKMDVYVGAMLGLPSCLTEDDFDQDMPTEVDDEYITEQAIMPMPPDAVPLAAAANANFRLAKILRKIVKSIYPIKGLQINEDGPSGHFSVKFATIRELEQDLQDWKDSLPEALQPGGPKNPSHVGPMQQLLRMAYGHAQMMLYRPFLHYVSSQIRTKTIDPRSYACAAACVSVSRNIIHITSEMAREGLIVSSYWFTMYTCFFAVLSLFYYAEQNPDDSTTVGIIRDAKEGMDTISGLAPRSMAADRCSSTLNTIYQSIQKRIERSVAGGGSATRSRKRGTSSILHNDESSVRGQELPPRAWTSPDRLPQTDWEAQAVSGAQKIMASGSQSARPHHQEYQGVSGSSSVSTPTITAHEWSLASQDPYSATRRQQNQFALLRQQETPAQKQSLLERRLKLQAQQQQQHSSSQYHDHQPQNLQPHQHDQTHHPYLNQNFGLPQLQDTKNVGYISDLSSMMFPSADPFAYPIQPITTLEQNYNYNRHESFPCEHSAAADSSDQYIPASTATSNSVSADDQMDVQLFGPMPSFLMHGGGGQTGTPQEKGQYGQQSQISPANEGLRVSSHGWSEQLTNQGLTSFNYDDLFGNEEEWRSAYP